jgi:hypothetical protein
LRGAAEHLACDVATEVEPPAQAAIRPEFFVLPPSSASRAGARVLVAKVLFLSREAVARAILDTVRANGLTEDTHIRITVTRSDAPSTGMGQKPDRSACGLAPISASEKA